MGGNVLSTHNVITCNLINYWFSGKPQGLLNCSWRFYLLSALMHYSQRCFMVMFTCMLCEPSLGTWWTWHCICVIYAVFAGSYKHSMGWVDTTVSIAIIVGWYYSGENSCTDIAFCGCDNDSRAVRLQLNCNMLHKYTPPYRWICLYQQQYVWCREWPNLLELSKLSGEWAHPARV